MGRKKTMYKHWELPAWEMAAIDVTDKFVKNNQQYLTVMDGSNRYMFRIPKQKGWYEIEKGNKIVVTKHLLMKNNARLELHLVE